LPGAVDIPPVADRDDQDPMRLSVDAVDDPVHAPVRGVKPRQWVTQGFATSVRIGRERLVDEVDACDGDCFRESLQCTPGTGSRDDKVGMQETGWGDAF
jgi:hypothetical protein